MLKQLFDYFIAFLGLVIFSPILFITAISIKLDSSDPVFFRQARVGKNGNIFMIHKFRTMKAGSDGSPLTSGTHDQRITRVGHIIRKLHLDELAQLIDVMQGNMSIVGPRPELPEYTKIYQEQWNGILKVKPGITGLASLKLSDWEYEILEHSSNGEQIYIDRILPRKLKLEHIYVNNSNICFDLKIVLQTLLLIFKT